MQESPNHNPNRLVQLVKRLVLWGGTAFLVFLSVSGIWHMRHGVAHVDRSANNNIQTISNTPLSEQSSPNTLTLSSTAEQSSVAFKNDLGLSKNKKSSRHNKVIKKDSKQTQNIHRKLTTPTSQHTRSSTTNTHTQWTVHKPSKTVETMQSFNTNDHPVRVMDTRSLFEKLVAARPLISPGSSVASPVAFGFGWGNAFVGVTGQLGSPTTSQPFGEYGAGFGLGDPNKYVSLATIATFGGLGEVTRDGNLNFQLSRNLTPGSAVALGVENVLPWGADTVNDKNIYAVTSRVLPIRITDIYNINVIGSVGVGNGRFVHTYTSTGSNKNDVNSWRPFANIGFQVLPQAALVIDYVGLAYNAGFSIIPFTGIPFVANVTAADLTNRGGSHIPIAGSLGYSIQFA